MDTTEKTIIELLIDEMNAKAYLRNDMRLNGLASSTESGWDIHINKDQPEREIRLTALHEIAEIMIRDCQKSKCDNWAILRENFCEHFANAMLNVIEKIEDEYYE